MLALFEPWEDHYRTQGFSRIAGVDEVGRGCIAGPVVAAAVILPEGVCFPGLNDSKKLTPLQRDRLFPRILEQAVAFGVGIVSVSLIDHLNILQASLLAMHQALRRMRPVPDLALIDGKMKIADLSVCHQETLIDGDARCASIAAASVVAKVTRDRLMAYCDRDYPLFAFATHKGYGTAAHLRALAAHGVTPLHRRSFAPVKDRVAQLR